MADPLQLPGYEVVRPIGAGGMGQVVLAIQTAVGRQVALKFVHPGRCDARGAERLRREAALAARVAHPNVVGVFDCQEVDGRPVIVMEFVPGQTLSAWIAADNVDDGHLISWLAQVAAALAAAHAAGILHRDIKASNILIRDDGVAKLGDFGLAVIADFETTTAAGTPNHLAPEVLAGGKPSPASDAFALGVTAWHALARRLPVSGTLAKVRSDLPAELTTAVDGLLNQDPSRRPLIADVLPIFLKAAQSLGSTTQVFQQPLAKNKTRPWLVKLMAVILLVFSMGIMAWCLLYYVHQEKHKVIFDDKPETSSVPVSKPTEPLPDYQSDSSSISPSSLPTDSVLLLSQPTVIRSPFLLIRPEVHWSSGKAYISISAIPNGYDLTAVSRLQWSDDGHEWIDFTAPYRVAAPNGLPMPVVQTNLPSVTRAQERTIWLRFQDLHEQFSESQKYTFMVPPDPAIASARQEFAAWDALAGKSVKLRYSWEAGIDLEWKPWPSNRSEYPTYLRFGIDSEALSHVVRSTRLRKKLPIKLVPGKHVLSVQYFLPDKTSSGIYQISFDVDGRYSTMNGTPVRIVSTGSSTKPAISQDNVNDFEDASEQEPIPPATGKMIDLLPMIDTKNDGISGSWQKQGNVLRGIEGSSLSLPYEPPDEYDIKIDFYTDSTLISVLCWKGDRSFQVGMKGWNHNLCGIRWIDGKDLNENDSMTIYPLASDRRHHATIFIRNDRIGLKIEDDMVFIHPVDYSKLSDLSGIAWRKRQLGLFVYKHLASIFKLQVIEVEAPGASTQKSSP